MKIQLHDNIYHHRSTLSDPGAKNNEGGTLKNNSAASKIKKEMNYKINTTASKNTRGRTSFKGLNNTVAKETTKTVKESKFMINLAHKLEKNEKMKKVLDYIGDNPLLSEALFALLITCGLRPATIMVTPGNGEDKEKNQYAAAHSIASGVIGLATTVLISQPIKKAIDNIMPELEKPYAGLAKEELGKKVGNMKSVLERLHTPIFLPIRAAVTIALIPVILGALGIKKAKKNSTTLQKAPLVPTNTKKVFQSFAGVSQHEN